MDHVYEKLIPYFEAYLEDYMKEDGRNQYTKLSDNPVYPQIKAVIDSMNPLREYLGYKRLKLSELVSAERERRKS